jgi:cytochrome c oxidase cbb3-type subunit IV
MYKNVLENINGIEVFPLISLVVFFIFFTVIVIWALKADKSYLNKMSKLPLEENTAAGGSK